MDTFNKGKNQETEVKGKMAVDFTIKSKKRPGIPAIWKVLQKAKRAFEPQLTITNEVKLQCIEKQIGAFFPDPTKFWSEFMTQAGKLMDSMRYLRDCANLGVSPMNVAEHIVFLGSATINKVLKNGVENTLARDLELYVDRLSSESANVFRAKMESGLSK